MIEKSDDEKALEVLEKAVYHAKELLEKTTVFQPFVLLLNDEGKLEYFDNEIKDSRESYALLEKDLKIRVQKADVAVLALVVDTAIPENFVKDVPMSIRLHLEEKSQIEHKIGARHLYVPYELCKGQDKMFVRLHVPIPVGFPAEYIVSVL
ncbi:MAG: hypothetical protein DRQ78_06055 [Epsilonproteobacteria bacterium]|nr:MAG: hypothetical protein DRQ78_06055 [Campylobacterota bacterium]